ncbi:MAG: hydroxyacid dehydrogenase [Lentimicrobiaceae bacterium]|nr:hydroxyacid dehydrogenase [Lentimicrobiaceae bacterium]
MKKGKILFIDSTQSELSIMLEEQGFICESFSNFSRDEYKKIVSGYVGIVIRSKVKLDEDFLQHCHGLKFIARVGAGMENIDVAYAEKCNIICLNAPEGNRDAVGEQALGMILALFNRIIVSDREVREGKWIREGNRGIELSNKTVGIIGYGNTGSAFAKKLAGFGVKVISYDKYKTDYSDNYVLESTMEKLFDECDIVSLHTPLTDETQDLVNNDFLESFRKNIYIVNTSRGKILNTADLVSALDRGKVIGACLDVIEYEGLSFEDVNIPKEFKELIKNNNVILTPHIAGWTHESNHKMALTIARKIGELEL